MRCSVKLHTDLAWLRLRALSSMQNSGQADALCAACVDTLWKNSSEGDCRLVWPNEFRTTRATSMRYVRELYRAGLFTAVCGSCYRLLGFSMMEQAESPRIPFEIALCLDWENGFGQWQDAEGGRDPCARAQGGNVQPQASDA